MCRNIKLLFNFDPPATKEEIRQASLQYVRKLSGVNKPSLQNEKAFNQAVESIAKNTQTLIDTMTTSAPSKNREIEKEKAHKRVLKRFGDSSK